MKQLLKQRMRFWCPHCKYSTPHSLLKDVQGQRLVDRPPRLEVVEEGLAWRCDRCSSVQRKTAHQVSTAAPV